MEGVEIKIEGVGSDHVDEQLMSERCLICSNRCSDTSDPLQTSWSMDSFKSLLGRDKGGEECLSSHLLSIFILRKLLDYPKMECEDLLQSLGVVHPGEWFRLCPDCSEVVEKVLECLQQVVKLEKKIDALKKSAKDKLYESLRWEGESSVETVTMTISARDVIRGYLKISASNLKELEQQKLPVDKETPVEGNLLACFNNWDFDLDETRKQEVDANLEENLSTPFGYDFECVTDPDYVSGISSVNISANSDDHKNAISRGEISSVVKRRRGRPRKTVVNDILIPTHEILDVCGESENKNSIQTYRTCNPRDFHSGDLGQQDCDSTQAYRRLRKRVSKTGQHPSVPARLSSAENEDMDDDVDQLYIPQDADEVGSSSTAEESENDKDEAYDISSMRKRTRKLPKSSTRIYKPCDICGESMRGRLSLYFHMRRYHPATKKRRMEEREKLIKRSAVPLTCDICGKTPANVDAFDKHMRIYHKEIHQQRKLEKRNASPKLKCPNCPKLFSRDLHLQKHIKWKICSKEKKKGGQLKAAYHCDKCDFTGVTPKIEKTHMHHHKIMDHRITKDSENNFSCNMCHEVFPNLREVYKHSMKRHKKELGIKYKESSSMNNRVGCLRVHEAVTSNSGSGFKCNFCSGTYPTLYRATKHAREYHRKELGLKEKVLSLKPILKPYKCSQCVYSCRHKCALSYHVKKVHDKVREIFCEKCGASFSERRSLLKHMARFHSEEQSEPVICDICGKSVISKQALNSHKRYYHTPDSACYKDNIKNGIHKCLYCGEQFNYTKALRNHQAVTHPEIFVHQCLNCPKKFITNCGLLTHEKKNHSTD